jgi:exosortase
MTAQPIPAPRISTSAWTIAALLGLAVLWSYGTTLAGIVQRWWIDPQYSHGFLVPIFAGYVLWLRRERWINCRFAVNWLGLVLLGAAVGLRLYGAYVSIPYYDQISLLPCCTGLVLLAGGWPALKWSWPAIAFLAFMVPLPHRVSVALSAPMQALATNVSTFCLQVLGRPAVAEGNIIRLNDVELGIVEACSGLSMLMTFFALSVAVAMLVHKPMWEKCLLAASAVPIAIVSNVLRITFTGLLTDSFGKQYANYFHDNCGYLMPVIGSAFLLVEMGILKKLLIERPSDPTSTLHLQRVEIDPVALYRDSQLPRRKKPVVEPEAQPEPVAVK